MQRQLKLYLDTSIISHIFAPHKPVHEKITNDFFELVTLLPDQFLLVISPIVLLEIDNCPKPKKEQLIDLLARISYTVLQQSDEVSQLVNSYLEEEVLGASHLRDLSHIAYATVARCDFIVSWNMKHFVKATVIDRVQAANMLNHYMSPYIATPTIFIEERDDDIRYLF